MEISRLPKFTTLQIFEFRISTVKELERYGVTSSGDGEFKSSLIQEMESLGQRVYEFCSFLDGMLVSSAVQEFR